LIDLIYATFLPGRRIAANFTNTVHTMDRFKKTLYKVSISELIDYYHFSLISAGLLNMALNEIWKIFGYIGKMNVINTYYFIINQDNRLHTRGWRP
jgi:hypothetical protein